MIFPSTGTQLVSDNVDNNILYWYGQLIGHQPLAV